MKKQLLLLCIPLFSLPVSAQTYVGNFPSSSIDVIPRVVSDQKSTYICTKDYHDGFVGINILDENLEMVRNFDVKVAKYQAGQKHEERSRTLILDGAYFSYFGTAETWEDAKEIIKGVDSGELVDRTGEGPFQGWMYSGWIFTNQLWPAPSRYYDFYVIEDGGGNTRASRRSDEDYTGMYPRFIFDWNPDTKEVRRLDLSYREGYQGEWKTISEESWLDGDVIRTRFVNYDDNAGAEQRFFVTQTLFNDDENFEIIAPIYDESYSRVDEGDRDGDGQTDYRYTYNGGRIVGYSVISEYGNSICTFDPPSGYYFSGIERLVKMNGHYYLLISMGSDEAGWSYGFYKIDHETSLVQYVKSLGMTVSPAIANKSELITVTLGKDSNAKEIRVVNAQGQTIKNIPIKEGQNTVTFSAQGLSRGLNIINAPDGKGIESSKIIIK